MPSNDIETAKFGIGLSGIVVWNPTSLIGAYILGSRATVSGILTDAAAKEKKKEKHRKNRRFDDEIDVILGRDPRIDICHPS
ncbi:hypothetical protein [Thalassobium sp. R2A62]|jgi:hypothetical protein|uniref:hypothetical protein n=1 Tax=Thalassobium sp. R2A62 TaxID=633131 RepID=UPI0001B1D592|nr:hypothetical protein [Thalassobium sp. R2A62]EET49181.1 hypothetical protein TR2A62_1298 [Thalassobium sp. R2A62]